MLGTSGRHPRSFMTQIFHKGQPSRVTHRKTLDVMTNVHQPNRFGHKQILWYDYIFPHKKDEMTRTTSGQKIFKGE